LTPASTPSAAIQFRRHDSLIPKSFDRSDWLLAEPDQIQRATTELRRVRGRHLTNPALSR
jgi:hypothetical protein